MQKCRRPLPSPHQGTHGDAACTVALALGRAGGSRGATLSTSSTSTPAGGRPALFLVQLWATHSELAVSTLAAAACAAPLTSARPLSHPPASRPPSHLPPATGPGPAARPSRSAAPPRVSGPRSRGWAAWHCPRRQRAWRSCPRAGGPACATWQSAGFQAARACRSVAEMAWPMHALECLEQRARHAAPAIGQLTWTSALPCTSFAWMVVPRSHPRTACCTAAATADTWPSRGTLPAQRAAGGVQAHTRERQGWAWQAKHCIALCRWLLAGAAVKSLLRHPPPPPPCPDACSSFA